MASMLFGSAFNVTRIRMQKRQGEIARLAGIDASYLASIECGRRKAPNRDVVDKLLPTLNVDEPLRKKLRSLAIIDRMLDVVEGQAADDLTITRLNKLLRQVADFNEGEWDSLECALAALTNQCLRRKEG
ncbi:MULTISPECIES: helix-turn-helix transcriptional regulator [unclassified Janthinobacterium]|uniref:helix-turn-helix domain-containing protein n=1 Tax=unclassified Janthinobacterium TaxID=2610881 RepID=UPI0018C93E01|nr:helix-turn-helix transcriptional regulator [Janthinobacterium sp. CG_23.4]MDH6159990.1 transcriptional regulator with XRE-family HTH domain [Janthinobacterium sp. CG_23.4]